MSNHEDLIEKSILGNQASKFTRILNLHIIATLQSYHDHLSEVITILENGLYTKIEAIEDLPKAFDDLTIVKFKDQNQNIFYGIVYDSNEMWQDPIVTHIFPFVTKEV